MGESVKAVLALALIICLIVIAFSLMDDRPDFSTWTTSGVAFLIGAGCFGLLLKLHLRKDLAPDFLMEHAGTYFNRDGFCFAPGFVEQDGVCRCTIWFQNQRDQPSVGRVALRPTKGFWLTRAKIEWITFQIECEPAAFGVAMLPIALPKDMQGKKQSFEVGASVDYPNGKGQRMRFRDGVFLRTNAKFGDGIHPAITVAGAMGGMVVISKPATLTVVLPVGVADELPQNGVQQVETHWRLGDSVPASA